MRPELTRLTRRAAAAAGVLSLTVAGALTAAPAMADTAPADATLPTTVSSDALPTAQIDGIAWDQDIAGTTVYVGGRFTSVRPAGAAPGVGTVARSHMMAYDIRTGEHTSFAPVFNGQVRQVAVSPDGTRVYAVGEFTAVNGVTRYRIAAFDTATGQLISSFRPAVNARIASVTATDTTVYFGGIFSSVNGQPRTRVAAVSAATGAVLPAVGAADNGQVTSLVVSPDGSSLVVGGNFTTFNGSSRPGYGLARVSTSTGEMLPLPANDLIRNAGPNSSITSLSGDADHFYGSGYHYGSGGNLEGTFAADWSTGAIVWVEDCHGDTYQSAPVGDVVYSASHKHYCGNTVGGFPQTDPWSYYRATAVTKAVRGTVTRDPHGYFNYAGNPSPELLNWFPTLDTGTVSGATQGPWAVTGNDQYVVMGGEFQRVNDVPQQGLVRFANPAIAPNQDGPRLAGAAFNPRVLSLAPGEVRVAWRGNFDRDNKTLTYRVYREGTVEPLVEETITAPFWQLRGGTFVDTGLQPGSTQRYRVTATDPKGNTAQSELVPVTVATDGTATAYADEVLGDGAGSYWRLSEPSGSVLRDWAAFTDATAGTGVTRGTPGAVPGDAASSFDGTVNGVAATTEPVPGPNTFTVEAWVNTTSTTGGKIIGFGNASKTSSGSYDRHVYMDDAGRLFFGVYPNTVRTINSTASYNDGQWHHVVATLGPTGMRLYVDGVRVAQRTDTTSGQSYSGYWRIGGDTVANWPSAPTSPQLAGALDDVAVYPTVLSNEQVLAHYTASGRTAALPPLPRDSYGASVRTAGPELYWRLGEASGTTAADTGLYGVTATYRNGVTLGAEGALSGVADPAVRLDGVDDFVASDVAVANPTTYSQEVWFSTTSTSGGRIIGFGNSRDGLSTSYDRHVYLESDGRLTFGTWTGQKNLITSPAAYNDGAWHHVVATQSAEGMRLYVDGQLVAQGTQTKAQSYTGYWRVGGDRNWGPGTWFAGRLDEAAVYAHALSAETVAEHYGLGTTGEAPNQAPTAAFTQSVDGLTVTVDGATSSDADGTVAAYAWTFGDGTTATGATASRTYAEAGTYTVTLSVTDDDGAVAQTSQTVTVTSPPPPPANVAPTAGFTSQVSDLTVTVDGSGSTDPDGVVALHAWEFGDGATATGVTAAHTYAAAGTYTVRLTVTDDAGATDVETASVTVTAPPAPPADDALARDAFGRSVSGGWGAAEVGGPWSTSGAAAAFSVDGAVARQTMAAPGANLMATLSEVSSADTEVQVQVAVDKMATGGGTYLSVVGRQVGSSDYRARLRLYPSGAVVLQTMRSGTTLDAVTVSGLTYAPGELLQVRVQVTGTAPTTIRAKVWKVGQPEPADWQRTSTDATAALQTAGAIGVGAYLSGTSTNAPVVATIDELWVGRPGGAR